MAEETRLTRWKGRARASWADWRSKHSLRRWVIGIVLALLAYPVLGTLALMTGLIERLVSSEDLRVEIENPAFTIWPGHVHMNGARILVNGETQFELQASNLAFDVVLLELFWNRFHIGSIEGDEVKFRLRVQVATTEGIEERIAAYPPLEDLPGDPTILLGKSQQTEERESDFVVQVDDIHAKVSELWFMEYRYLGDGTLDGAFLVGKDRMQVYTSVQELGPGDLRFGPEQVIAKRFRGRIEAEVPENKPSEHADESFLELVTADIRLSGDVVSLEHLKSYLDRMETTGGAGPLAARLLLEEGSLGEDSRITFRTDKVGLRGPGFAIETDWELDAEVTSRPQAGLRDGKDRDAPSKTDSAASRAKHGDDGSKATTAKKGGGSDEDGAGASGGPLPKVRSTSKATYVSFANDRGTIFTVQILGHEERATLRSGQLGSMTDIRSARLSMPRIVTNDLDDLGALTAKDSQVKSKSGKARASLVLEVDENHVARGPFQLDFDDALLVVAGVRLSADGKVGFQVRSDLDRKSTRLGNIRISLRDGGMHVGDEHVEGWWMNLRSKSLAAYGWPPNRLETALSIRAKDAEPILESLAEKDQLNDLIAKFTSLDDLRVEAEIRKNGEALDVLLEQIESDVFDIAGRVYSKADDTRMAIVVGGKAVSLGIASDRDGTSFQPFAGADWLNEQLRKFPKPVEQLAPPKP